MSRAGTETAEKICKKRRVRASWDIGHEGRRIKEGMNTGKCDKYWDRGERGQERGGLGRVKDDTGMEHSLLAAATALYLPRLLGYHAMMAGKFPFSQISLPHCREQSELYRTTVQDHRGALCFLSPAYLCLL